MWGSNKIGMNLRKGGGKSLSPSPSPEAPGNPIDS